MKFITLLLKSTCAFFLSIVISKTISAEIKLEDIHQSVEQYFPAILASLQDQEKVLAQQRNQKGAYDPLLKLSYKENTGENQMQVQENSLSMLTSIWGTEYHLAYKKGRGQFGAYDEMLKTSYHGEIEAGITIPILKNGSIDKVRAKLSQLDAGYTISQLDLNLLKFELKRMASHYYFDWLDRHQKYLIIKQLLELVKERNLGLIIRAKKGDIANIEQIDNERTIHQREVMVLQAEKELRETEFELSLFYRNAEQNPIVVQSQDIPLNATDHFRKIFDFDIKKCQDMISFTVDEHPEIKRLKSVLDQNAIDQSFYANARLPKLNFEFSSSRNIDILPNEKNKTDTKFYLVFELPLGQREYGGKIREAQAEASKQREYYKLTQDKLTIKYQKILMVLDNIQKKIFHLKKELSLAHQVESAEKIKFQNGDSTILLVNLREVATLEAQNKFIDTQYEYLKNYADFNALTVGNNCFNQQ